MTNMNFVVSHNGPAGTSYDSMMEAGTDILRRNCQAFLDQEESAMLPPLFVNRYTQLSAEEDGQQRGEDNEMKVIPSQRQVLWIMILTKIR